MTLTLPPPGFENWGKLAPQCLLLLLLLLGALAALCGLCCCPKPSTDEINKGKRSRAKLTFLTGCRFFLSNWIVCGHFLPRGDSPFDKAAAITNEGGASGRKRRTAGGGMAGKKVLLGNSALTR